MAGGRLGRKPWELPLEEEEVCCRRHRLCSRLISLGTWRKVLLWATGKHGQKIHFVWGFRLKNKTMQGNRPICLTWRQTIAQNTQEALSEEMEWPCWSCRVMGYGRQLPQGLAQAREILYKHEVDGTHFFVLPSSGHNKARMVQIKQFLASVPLNKKPAFPSPPSFVIRKTSTFDGNTEWLQVPLHNEAVLLINTLWFITQGTREKQV